MRFSALLLQLALVTADGLAQDRAIPRELAVGLLTYQTEPDSTQRVEILVGRAPANWSIPNLNFELLGSSQNKYAATIVYRIRGDLLAAHQKARDQFQVAGWRDPPNARPPEVGFIATQPEMLRFAQMCRGKEMAMIETAVVEPDLKFLKLRLNRHERNACTHADFVHDSPMNPWENLPLPKLQPPKGARVSGGGIAGSGRGRFASSAIVASDLSTAKLIEHYSEQLHAKGWSSRGEAGDDLTRVHTWRIAHRGKDWLASFIATPVGERRHIVEISFYNLTELERWPF